MTAVYTVTSERVRSIAMTSIAIIVRLFFPYSLVVGGSKVMQRIAVTVVGGEW